MYEHMRDPKALIAYHTVHTPNSFGKSAGFHYGVIANLLTYTNCLSINLSSGL